MPVIIENDFEVRLLLEAIFEKYSYDFRGYSMPSVKRRLETALSYFNVNSLSRIQEKVIHDPAFFSELLQFMTIPTTEMFRDPDFFYKIKTQVFPVLETYPSLKIWIAGCSTGEEIYSYSILLHEAGLLGRSTIYATDINPVSLMKAELGILPLEKIRDFEENYKRSGGEKNLKDYITSNDQSAMFHRFLKENVVFADHSLATDSAFSEMHLISCRNVLIYFERELQNRAIGLFTESLARKGFLGLGSKETLRFSSFESEYEEFCGNEKIYRKR